MKFETYQSLEDSFASGNLHPGDLKQGIADAINDVLEPIRVFWNNNSDLIKLTKAAVLNNIYF